MDLSQREKWGGRGFHKSGFGGKKKAALEEKKKKKTRKGEERKKNKGIKLFRELSSKNKKVGPERINIWKQRNASKNEKGGNWKMGKRELTEKGPMGVCSRETTKQGKGQKNICRKESNPKNGEKAKEKKIKRSGGKGVSKDKKNITKRERRKGKEREKGQEAEKGTQRTYGSGLRGDVGGQRRLGTPAATEKAR